MLKLRIPKNYIDPKDEGLRLESPWVVPESAIFLAGLLKGTETVFDVGMGASTLFYARRCNKVYGIETNREFLNKVLHTAYVHGLEDSIESKFISNQSDIENEIETIYFPEAFDIISIDTVWKYNRSELFKKASQKLKPTGILVLDNYANSHLFPSTYNWSHTELLKFLKLENTHQVYDFDDANWIGKGTRIIAPSMKLIQLDNANRQYIIL
jgi:SAM-dependent methyltransferase